MTALRQEQRQSAPEYTAEDVAAVARFMGWTPVYVPEGSIFRDSVGELDYWRTASGDSVYLGWCPFTDANEDFEVLERAREVWGDDERLALLDDALENAWMALPWPFALCYGVGDWSRAVLEVLRSMPEEEKP